MKARAKEPPHVPREVVDEQGHLYRLKPELGRGGQGVVWRTGSRRRLVKLLNDKNHRFVLGENARLSLLRRLQNVRMHQLGDLPVARPLAMLDDPYTGYVMELLSGMVPLGDLFPMASDDPLEVCRRGGGLRRQLRLLSKAASVMARLHGRGLVYVDASPGNIFVSSAVEEDHVCLIDTDNVRFTGIKAAPCYTPGYGAPELISRLLPASSKTDAFSFAVIAFELLTQRHPYRGELAKWDAEGGGTEMFNNGQLPWIDDEDDTRNATSEAIPREIVLSPRTRELFQLALGAGRTDPSRRPGMAMWARTLLRAADFTIVCPECGLSYYVPVSVCPWCGAGRKPGMLYIEARRCQRVLDHIPWDGDPADGDIQADKTVAGTVVWRKVLTENVDTAIEKHVLTTTLRHEADPACLRVEYESSGLRLAPADHGDFYIAMSGQGQWEPLRSGRTIDLEDLAHPVLLECRSGVRDRRVLLLRHLPWVGP